jgi:lipopolysaccharide export system permease protein
MKYTLDYMVIRMLVPVLLVALLFFVTILQLVDLFENLTRYIDLQVPLSEVLRVQILFLPRSVHFALPMALLFSVAFTLGTLYSNNELIAVFGSGISLTSFVAPVVLLGMLFSVGSFFFEERVVIDSFREKNDLQDQILNISRSQSDSNVTRLGQGARLLYHAEYFNDANETLSSAVFLRRSEAGRVEQLIHAQSARWIGDLWEARSARVFDWVEEDTAGGFVESFHQSFQLDGFDLPPDAFRRIGRDIEQMRMREARSYIETQRSAGLPYREDLTQYYERFSFAFTPLIVVLIATAIGGRFRKNILLMSLLVSLSVSVVYYVVQFLSGLLARSGAVSPIAGAWSGVLLFIAIGVVVLRYSRT